MKRFKFKFDQLQKVRERTEEAALLRLTLAQRDLAREEKLLAELAESVELSGQQLSDLLQGGGPIELLRNADKFRLSRVSETEQQSAVLRQAEAKTAEAREVFRQARQQAEAIRKLREKGKTEHRLESLRELQQELDEMGRSVSVDTPAAV